MLNKTNEHIVTMMAEGGKLTPEQEQLIAELVEDFKPSVKQIEAKFATTKGHYGDYMTLLSTLSQDPKKVKFYGILLKRAGANPAGVNAAVGLITGSEFADGGPLKRNLSRDRKFVSQQEWEQKYERKTPGKKYRETGGEMQESYVYQTDDGGDVEGFVCTWQKASGKYEGRPVIFGVMDNQLGSQQTYLVVSGILVEDGKLEMVTEAHDDWFGKREQALEVAKELAINQNAFIDQDDTFAKGGVAAGEYAVIHFAHKKPIKKRYDSAYKAFSDYEGQGSTYAELFNERGHRLSSYPASNAPVDLDIDDVVRADGKLIKVVEKDADNVTFYTVPDQVLNFDKETVAKNMKDGTWTLVWNKDTYGEGGIVPLNNKEDQHWERLLAFYRDNGLTEAQAERAALVEMKRFPRLKRLLSKKAAGGAFSESGYTVKGRPGRYWIDDVEKRLQTKHYATHEEAVTEVKRLSASKKARVYPSGPSVQNLIDSDRYYANGGATYPKKDWVVDVMYRDGANYKYFVENIKVPEEYIERKGVPQPGEEMYMEELGYSPPQFYALAGVEEDDEIDHNILEVLEVRQTDTAYATGGFVSKGELSWGRLNSSERMDFLLKHNRESTPRGQEILAKKQYRFLPRTLKQKIDAHFANIEAEELLTRERDGERKVGVDEFKKGGEVEEEFTFSAPFDGEQQIFKAIFSKELNRYFVSNDDSIHITISPLFDDEIKSEEDLQTALNEDDQSWVEDADNIIRENIKGATGVSMGLIGYDGFEQFKKSGTVTIEINFDFTINPIDFKKWIGENEVVVYKGKKYPTRTLVIVGQDLSKPMEVVIGTESLENELRKSKWRGEAKKIDSGIYFYVADDCITLSDEELAKKLDAQYRIATKDEYAKGGAVKAKAKPRNVKKLSAKYISPASNFDIRIHKKIAEKILSASPRHPMLKECDIMCKEMGDGQSWVSCNKTDLVDGKFPNTYSTFEVWVTGEMQPEKLKEELEKLL